MGITKGVDMSEEREMLLTELLKKGQWVTPDERKLMDKLTIELANEESSEPCEHDAKDAKRSEPCEVKSEVCCSADKHTKRSELQRLDVEEIFGIISKYMTRNPDRFYDPKAMADDRELSERICKQFGTAKQELQRLSEVSLAMKIWECNKNKLYMKDCEHIAKAICQQFGTANPATTKVSKGIMTRTYTKTGVIDQ
jgi:hypothetical protein